MLQHATQLFYSRKSVDMILTVIFVVLMMFWLFYGGWATWNGPAPNPIAFGGTIIPWLCVAILGWIIFGGGSLPLPPR